MIQNFTRRTILTALAVAASTGAAAVGASTRASAQTTGKPMTTASGLQIIDSKVGTGAAPQAIWTAIVLLAAVTVDTVARRSQTSR